MNAPFRIDPLTEFAYRAPRTHQLAAAVAEVAQVSWPVAFFAAISAIVVGANLSPRVVRHKARRHPTILCPTLVGEPGVGKTPALDLVLRQVSNFDADWGRKNSLEEREREAALAAWQCEEARLKRKLRSGKEDVKAAFAAHVAMKPEKGYCRKILYTNSTYAALFDRLAQGGLVVLKSDEAAALKRSGLMRDGKFAAFYAADPVDDDTRLHGARTIRRPRLVLCIAIQPGPFQKWIDADDGTFRASGMAQRLWLVRAMPNFGYRDFCRDLSGASSVLAEHDSWMSSQLANAQFDDASESEFQLTPEAARSLDEWATIHECQQQPGMPYFAIRDAASKTYDMILRLAGNLEWRESGSHAIGPNAVRAAIILAELSLHTFNHVLGPDESASVEQFRVPRLLHWLRQRLFLSWKAEPEIVLKAECPYEACPPKYWAVTLASMQAMGLARIKRGLVSLTPDGFGPPFNSSPTGEAPRIG